MVSPATIESCFGDWCWKLGNLANDANGGAMLVRLVSSSFHRACLRILMLRRGVTIDVCVKHFSTKSRQEA